MRGRGDGEGAVVAGIGGGGGESASGCGCGRVVEAAERDAVYDFRMGRREARVGMGRIAGGDEDGGTMIVDVEEEKDGRCRSICSRMYACMPPSSPSSSCIDWTASADVPAVWIVVAGCGGERINAITGGGADVRVLKRDIRSIVLASWAGRRSEGMRSRKSWWIGGEGGGASGCC